MPIPVVAGILAILGLLGGAFVIAVNWDAIVLALTGKTLAVLGVQETGKTTLIKFITEGTVSEQYKATAGSVNTSGRRFALKELRLDVAAGRDVGGGEDNYSQWGKLVRQADYVLYLIRYDQLAEPDHAERVRSDLGQITGWLAARATRPPFWLIVTHVDLDPKYLHPDDEARKRLANELAQHPLLREALIKGRNGDARGGLVVGSLRTPQDAELLVAWWLGQVGGAS